MELTDHYNKYSDIVEVITSNRLRWFRHELRKKEQSPQILEYNSRGRRAHGRPQFKIEIKWRSSAEGCLDLVVDWNQWKATVHGRKKKKKKGLRFFNCPMECCYYYFFFSLVNSFHHFVHLQVVSPQSRTLAQD